MFTLNRLLKIDALHHTAAALPQCLGDSYLYAKNPIYRRIRDAFFRAGGRYSDSGAQLVKDYNILSLLCLPEILRELSVPFVDNTSLLARLAQQNPEFAVSAAFLSGSLRRNYLLHESAHCIAHSVLSAMPTLGDGEDAGAGDRFVLEALLGESFAMAAEKTAWALAHSPTHVFLYSLNSYTANDPEVRRIADEAIALTSAATVFRLAFITFFYLNAGTAVPEDTECDSFVDLAAGDEPVSDTARSYLKRVVKEALSLNLAFRQDTTPTYFRLLNCEEAFARLRERKLDVACMESLGLREVLNRLTPIAIDASPATSFFRTAGY